MAKAAANAEFVVEEVRTKAIELNVIGTSPMILNRMSEKVRQELLLPRGRKTASEKAASLKHNPVEEFRSSPYVLDDDEAPTLLAHMASAFKGAAMTAALDIPGATRTKIGRLLWVRGQYIGIFGTPYIFSAVTRSADINRTPDIRTRAIVPEWAATIVVEFAVPLLHEQSVINLFAAAGKIAGIGDWRPEKGKGSYGQYKLVDPDNEEFQRIVTTGNRANQIEAMTNPKAYDSDTADLLAWFDVEARVRGKLD